MRPLELRAFLGLAGLVLLLWVGWLFRLLSDVWVPIGGTALVVLLLAARIVLLSIRQD